MPGPGGAHFAWTKSIRFFSPVANGKTGRNAAASTGQRHAGPPSFDLQPVPHPRLGEQVLRPGRVGFEFPAKLAHVDPEIL